MGVGYIIGYRSSAIMVGGGLLSWLVLIPAIALFGEGRAAAAVPGHRSHLRDAARATSGTATSATSARARWRRAGSSTSSKAMPTIIDSFRASFRDLKLSAAGEARRAAPHGARHADLGRARRLRRARPLHGLPAPAARPCPGIGIGVLSAIAIIVFGFFFSVVSSRITGELGSSSNPVSGMAIATLMGVCLIFVALGWTGHAVHRGRARPSAPWSASRPATPGTTSQDLKTSFLVGGTPWKQQVGAHRRRDHERGRHRRHPPAHQQGRTARSRRRRTRSSLAADAGGAETMSGPDGAAYRVARVGRRGGHPRRPLPRRPTPARCATASRRASAPRRRPRPRPR